MNTLNVKKVLVSVRPGLTDLITIEIDGPTPFPEWAKEVNRTFNPSLFIETREGYAQEWLRQLGIDESLIEYI